MSWITFKIAVAGILLFVVLAWFRISLQDAWGWIRYKISGAGMVVIQDGRRAVRRSRL